MRLTRVIERFPVHQWYRESPRGFLLRDSTGSDVRVSGQVRNSSGADVTVARTVRDSTGSDVTVQ